ncbi:transposase [uncultured Phascolarctobacterium sp.]|uniref:transposase n=1 Tax=uncultured Phascolarctobacterium sp. TaxID=512296 RepID=UPI003451C5AA
MCTKENFGSFNKNKTIEVAQMQMDSVIQTFANSGLPELEEFYIMIRNWCQEIVNSFTVIQDR